MKSRSDFYLADDYTQYVSVEHFISFLEKNLKEGKLEEALHLLREVDSASYIAGYANAKFDQAERE
jgi:hypothetical protein